MKRKRERERERERASERERERERAMRRDCIVVGAGHNALTCAAYLARAGLDVLVLERRNLVGGCAVTEEFKVDKVGSFKFSRASYLAGLLRPQIVTELGLVDKHGLNFIGRDPYSFTPGKTKGDEGLTLWNDLQKTRESVGKYSQRDARHFEDYERFLDTAKRAIVPLLDGAPPDVFDSRASLRERWEACRRVLRSVGSLTFAGKGAGVYSALDVSRLFTSPASDLLGEWFEGDALKATLATDAIIGSMVPPSQPGSGYVLLHHVMGEALKYGTGSSWCYVQGGMGSITQALANAATDAGAEIRTGCKVDKITLRRRDGRNGEAVAGGVVLEDGTEVTADRVVSGCDPHTTFMKLIRDGDRDRALAGVPAYDKFQRSVQSLDFTCGAAKINLALSKLPSFSCLNRGTRGDAAAGPEHFGTIHFEHSLEEIELAWLQCSLGFLPSQPVIEMTIPSSLDKTLAPPGYHVCQLFVQYVPYALSPVALQDTITLSEATTSQGKRSSHFWQMEKVKSKFVDTVLDRVETFCPGFKQSILHVDALSPLDLENVFGIHQGNIFHGALSLNQLFHQRPVPGFAAYQMPISNLFLAGSGAHPGGGVTGAPGRNCAKAILNKFL